MIAVDELVRMNIFNFLTDVWVYRIYTHQFTGDLTIPERQRFVDRYLKNGLQHYGDEHPKERMEYIAQYSDRIIEIFANKEDEFTDEVYQSLKASREERMRKNDYL